jgi:adenylate kinase family enzyme
MKSLDERIVNIDALDDLRRHARTLRQEAIEALTAHPYLPRPRKSKFEESAAARRQDWDLPGDDVEKAEMLRALNLLKPEQEGSEDRRIQSRDALIKDLSSITYKDLVDDKALDDVPIFRSALVLQALAETPGCALSRAALTCFYRIVQELNEVAGPAWTSGAARADDDAQPTAFVTGECARALLALETALQQTATAAEMLAREAAREAFAESGCNPWKVQEERFRKYSLEISLAALPYMIFPRSSPHDRQDSPKRLLEKIATALVEVPSIDSLGLPKPAAQKRRIPSNYLLEAAKEIAWHAVDQLLNALALASVESDPEALGRSISDTLKRAAQVVHDLVRPIEQFAESVIDRQIAAASPHLKVWVDGAELVFAATLLGLVSDWNRPKVRAAYEVLYPLLSANGRLLSIRPFDVGPQGYRLNVATLEVTRRLADLVGNLDVEPEAEFIKRLLLPFEYTRATGAERSQCGWTVDPPPREPKSLWWLTAIALDALGSIVRMLDETINRQVLRDFQVRRPDALKLKLDDLFYPDYGLATLNKENSIAFTLQRLRAHAGYGPAEEHALYSLILYGPPGTGKTTLVEAIAKTAGVPLVEVTPSDILVGGTEGVERRARQVFQSLSKLTHVVILLDEFDSILLDRSKRDPENIPASVIEFLTPGMLPKLKALNDASKKGRISYVLATNFADRLDDAVKRGGRFDHKHGVYPPDPISRLGRLLDLLKKLEQEDQKTKIKMTEENLKKLRDRRKDTDTFLSRILDAVVRTRSGPIDMLGRPGWYSMPRREKDWDETLVGYVFFDRQMKAIEGEAQYERDLGKYNEQRARKLRVSVDALPEEPIQYWKEWKQVEDLEERLVAERNSMNWNLVYKTMNRMVSPSS